ncbi:MAG TPA: indole-3-glycerol phosphate synthase TrpC [Solirubrobacteraceae bacterium]
MSAPTPTVLERILDSTRAELERRKRELPAEELEYRAFALGGEPGAGEWRFAGALREPGMTVIAEFKRRSPSAGTLRESSDVGEMVSAYERGGAGALSVLTEGPNFDGALEDLRSARAACGLPILRKDFIVDEYQLHEAKVAGADGVLLIVAALAMEELASLHERSYALGLDVLVEVHDGEELRRALSVGAKLIGINNRDLRDFSVDTERSARLMGEMPAGVTVVSESGIAGSEQLRKLEEAGVDAVLVGESLMRSSDPEAALRALRGDRGGRA